MRMMMMMMMMMPSAAGIAATVTAAAIMCLSCLFLAILDSVGCGIVSAGGCGADGRCLRGVRGW